MGEATTSAQQALSGRVRLDSLDAFRGLTIAAMILVNNPGYGDVYPVLEHAEWNGWTPTDLIFPFFLFIVGVSMVISLSRRRERGAEPKLLGHVLYRSAIIFCIGLFLNVFPHFELHTLRIPGVLQRIAFCYLLGSLVLLKMGRRGRLITVCTLLIGYWALMRFVPVPGYGAGRLDPEGNLAAYVDRTVFGSHVWQNTWDPEGLLSSFPALGTVLLGTFVGEWLQQNRPAKQKVFGLMVAGVAGLAIGWALNPLFPINKNLWTSTFCIFTAGFACVLLGLLYWVIEMMNWRAWATPLRVFGLNAILAYGLSSLLTKLLVNIKVGAGAGRTSLYGYIYQAVFANLANSNNSSLLYSLSYVLVWMGIMWVLYLKKIYLKV